MSKAFITGTLNSLKNQSIQNRVYKDLMMRAGESMSIYYKNVDNKREVAYLDNQHQLKSKKPKLLSQLGLETKDIVVLKSILNASSSYFSHIEFIDQMPAQGCDWVFVNNDNSEALSKWKLLNKRCPTANAIFILGDKDNAPQNLAGALIINKPFNLKKLQNTLNSNESQRQQSMNTQLMEQADDSIPLIKTKAKHCLSILIVDDSAPARQYIKLKVGEFLKPAEYELSFAVSGEEAISMSKEQAFDLVFLDVEMPGINGFEVCQYLRSQFKNLRIVMLTGKSLSEDYVTGRKSGCNHYLTKPPQDADVRTILTLSALKKKTGL